jgi:hypothetical protein
VQMVVGVACAWDWSWDDIDRQGNRLASSTAPETGSGVKNGA